MVGVGEERKMRAEAECSLGERVDGAILDQKWPRSVGLLPGVSGKMGKASAAYSNTVYHATIA